MDYDVTQLKNNMDFYIRECKDDGLNIRQGKWYTFHKLHIELGWKGIKHFERKKILNKLWSEREL
jgi:hypothetical protein